MSHTKGPWELTTRGLKAPIIGANGQEVCFMRQTPTLNESDAHLIAAAPDLLAAAELALNLLREPDSDGYFDAAKLETMLETAINKAKGK